MAWVSSWGTTPHRQDTINTLLKRIASSASGGSGGGGGGGSGNLSGAGAPIGVTTPTAINQWYRDTSTENYYWATGLTNADWALVV